LPHIAQDRFFQKHIMEVVLKAFIFVEKTVSGAQFYEKFEYRSTLLHTLLYAWLMSTHIAASSP
jgi:hypothetical protein